MKRIFAAILALCLLLGLCACSPTTVVPGHSSQSEESPASSSFAPSGESESADSDASTQEPEPESTQSPEPYAMQSASVQVYRNESGAVWALAFVEIENTGEDFLFLDSASLSLANESGREVACMESVAAYPQVIAPGETAVYCDVASLDTTEEISLSLGFSGDILPTQSAPVRFAVRDEALTDSLYGGLSLSATVENTTKDDCDLVCVAALLRDQNGTLLGFLSGYLGGALKAGESQTVNLDSFMLPTELSAGQVDALELYAFPLLDRP